MSTALEAASLIMIPTSYSDGLLASVKPNDGAGDFTFSRGSNLSATRINADGNIEKGYENLLLQSNNFAETSVWSEVLLEDPTTGETGYDGTNDAWKIQSDTTGSGQRIVQSFSSISGVYTLSVYAKAGTYSDELYIRSSGDTNYRAYFNLVSGDLAGGTNLISQKSTDLGNGWYRFEAVFNFGSATSFEVRFRNQNDAGSYFYIQDAMLNQGLVAYPYVETTTAPVAAGILEDMPRIDFSGGNQSLLLEPSRTNQIRLSEYFEDTTNYDLRSADIVANYEISPEGVKNATKVIPQNGTTNFRIQTQHIFGVLGDNVLSVFAKYESGGFQYLILAANSTFQTYAFDIQNGTKVGSAGGATIADDDATIELIGNGWYRCSIKSNNTGGADGVIYLSDDGTNATATGDGSKGMLIYGFQGEQSATYPTSYIPTYGVSQTRLGDVLGNSNNISGLFNDNKGTLYLETNDTIFKGETNNYNFFGLTESSSGSYFRFRGADSTILAQSGGFGSTISFNPNGATFTKYLYKWDGTNIKLFIDGVERGSVSQTATFNPDLFRIGFNFGFVSNTKQLLVFPTALSDDECITLTTI